MPNQVDETQSLGTDIAVEHIPQRPHVIESVAIDYGSCQSLVDSPPQSREIFHAGFEDRLPVPHVGRDQILGHFADVFVAWLVLRFTVRARLKRVV